MSDLLTHWAVFDDVRRLAAVDSQIEPLFNQILEHKSEAARLGAIARKGSIWMPHILQDAFAKRDEANSNERLQERIAFALGGILHFPADHFFKPMMSELAHADWHAGHSAMQRGETDSPTTVSIREISAYYDCHVFKRVYLHGKEAPFSRFLLAENETDAGQQLELFIRALFQRSLLSSHTLSPDMQNFDDWLDNLLDKIQPLYIDIALYSRVFAHPDPQKIAAFSVEERFYRDDDPILLLARRVQSGDSVSPGELDAALLPEANRSGFGECVRLGVQLLREAAQFWRGEKAEPPDVKQNFGKR